MNATPEQWRTVPGYPDYEVSDQGRVKSWRKYNGGPAPRILKQVWRGQYLCVQPFSAPRVSKSRAVHQLVAEAFIGPRPKGRAGEVVRHLDGNPENNALSNLAYGSFSDNAKDMVRHGTLVNPSSLRTHCPQGHPYSDENTYRNRAGKRSCRICCKKRSARQKAKARAAREARGPVPRKRRTPQTHCKNGHEFTPENTYWTSKGTRNCRTCRAARRARERIARQTRVRTRVRAPQTPIVEGAET